MESKNKRMKQKRVAGITETGSSNQSSKDLLRIEAHEAKRLERRRRRLERQHLPMSTKKVLFLSFFFPFMIFAIAFACQGMWPIRDTTPLTIDLYHQYAPFLAELRHKILNGESIFYSWHGGLGSNFYALFAYYLASPLNILMVLFPPNFLTEAVTVLTLLKIGLTGLTFSYMLREVYSPFGQRTIAAKAPAKVRFASETGTDWAQILFSSMFALSGFMLAYSWDIMWLDTIVLMPLVITGLYRLIRDGRFVLYVLSLSFAIIFNYYIALFVCLFTAFYFFVLYVTVSPDLELAILNKGGHFFKRFWQFAGASLLAGLISAFMSIPTYLALQITSATDDSFPSTWRLSFDAIEFISRHLIDMEPKIRSGLPNIYVGLAIFILLPIYLMAKNIRLSEKLAHLAMLALLYMSFNVNVFNFIWHGMHYPNQLPYRFAFVYSFVLVVMMYRAMSGLKDMSAAQIAMGAMSGILFIVMAEHLIPDEVDHETALVSILFLILLTACFSLIRDKRRSFRFVIQALAVVMVLELLVNTIVTITTIHINESYTRRSNFNNDFMPVRQELQEIDDLEDENSFYRVEMIQQKTTNSPALYGYNGFTIFSSTSYETTAKLMRNLGYHGNNINSYKYMSSTALLNSIFGIEYLINKDEAIRDPLLEELDTDSDYYSYRNPYAQSLGFMVSSDVLNWNSTNGTPFQIQNDFIARAGDFEEIFVPLEIETESAINMNNQSGTVRSGYAYTPANSDEDSEITLLVKSPIAQHVYFHVDVSWSMDVYATVEREGEPAVVIDPEDTSRGTIDDFSETTSPIVFDDRRGINKPEIFDVGFVEAGETVRIKINVDSGTGGRFVVSAAGLNQDVYTNSMEDLALRGLEIEELSSRFVRGTVATDEAGLLFLSIPYDQSWEALVNGVAVELVDVGNGLMGIELGMGIHRIELKFTPPGFWTGVMISIFGILVLLIALLIWRSMEGKRQERLRRARIALRQRLELEAVDAAGRPAIWQQSRVEPVGIRTTSLAKNETADLLEQDTEDVKQELVDTVEAEQVSDASVTEDDLNKKPTDELAKELVEEAKDEPHESLGEDEEVESIFPEIEENE